MIESVKKSRSELESILEEQKKLLGEHHPDTLVSSYNLIMAISELGDTEEALTLIEDLIPDFEKVFGEVSEETLLIKNSYAYLLEENEQSDDAIELMKELFDQYRENFGPERTLDIRIELAVAIEDASDGIEAGPYYDILIEDLEKFHGSAHIATINMRKRFAYAFYWEEYVPAQISALRELEVVLHDLYQLAAEKSSDIGSADIQTIENETFELYQRLNSYSISDHVEDKWRENISFLTNRYSSSHPAVLRHKHSLAICEFEQGKSEDALSTLNSLVNEQIKIYGKSALQTLSTRETIVEVLQNLNKNDEALELINHLIDSYADAFGPLDHRTLKTKFRLAKFYSNLKQYDKANDELDSLLEIYKQSRPSDGISYEEIELMIAQNLYALGNLDDALLRIRSAFDGQRAIDNASKCESILSELERFSSISESNRQLEDVIAFRRLSLYIHNEIFGQNGDRSLLQRGKLATALTKLDHFQEAADLRQSEYLDRKNLNGTANSATLEAHYFYALYLFHAGQNDQSISEFNSLLQEAKEYYRDDSKFVLNARQSQATVLCGSQRYEEARVILTKLLDDEVKLQHDKNNNHLTRKLLIGSLIQLERYSEAILLSKEIVDSNFQEYGAAHPQTLSSLRGLAFDTGNAGQYSEAIEIYDSLISEYKNTGNEFISECIIARLERALWIGKLTTMDQAVTHAEELLQELLKHFPKDNIDVMITRSNLAGFLADAGRIGEAIGMYESLVPDRARVLGADHPSTKKVTERLEDLREKNH